MECFRVCFFFCWISLHESSISFWSGIRYSKKARSLWGMMRGVRRSKEVNTPVLIRQMVRVRVTMLLYWGFKGVHSGRDSLRRGQDSSNRVSSISTRTIHQSTTPPLSQTIWLRWAPRQLLTPPYSRDLAPCDFWLFSSSEAVVMRQLRRWKRLWRRSLTHSYKRTSMEPWRICWNGRTSALQPEEITSKGTRVSCVVLSMKVPIWKKSGNLFNDPRIYYIGVWMSAVWSQLFRLIRFSKILSGKNK